MMRRSRSSYECGCILIGDEGPRDETNRWENTHPLLCPVHRAIWAGKSAEVVESGHDEQTEGSAHASFVRAVEEVVVLRRQLATERERTVAAVVEALREAAAELAPNEPAQASGVLIGIDRIENDPRFKPSAPGGNTAVA